MAKNSTFYFSHDYNARNDIKIKRLISKHGYLGYGLFWAIIEELYNNANALPLDYDVLAFDLRCDYDVIKSVIEDFELFVIDVYTFGSYSVERRLKERNSRSEKARESALYRWKKPKEDATALQTESDSNAIKESKVKESKEKENKENTFLLKKETKDNLSEISEFEVLETEEFKKEKSSAKKEKENKPDLSEFLEYAEQIIIENKLGSIIEYKLAIEAKFEQWSNNDWKDGHGKPIKRWKPKLKTAFQYFKPIKQNGYGNGQQQTRTQQQVFIDTANSETARNFKL